MDKLVDYVKIYVDYVAIVQIMRVNYEMSICVADSHVAFCSNELDFEVAKNLLCLFAEDSLDSFNLFKALEVISEWVGGNLGVAQNLDTKF